MVLDENAVSFDLVLTTPACPMKESIANACRTAIATMVDKNLKVDINITSNTQQSRGNNEVLSGIKNIIVHAHADLKFRGSFVSRVFSTVELKVQKLVNERVNKIREELRAEFRDKVSKVY